MKYQFILSYNIYENGLIVGCGLICRMSDFAFLDDDLQDEMIKSMTENIRKDNKSPKERYPADLKFTRFKK